MVSTKMFVDRLRVCYIIGRNHSNTFFFVKLQKTKTSPKYNSAANYLLWYQTFDSLDILISAEISLILRKFKLHQEN